VHHCLRAACRTFPDHFTTVTLGPGTRSGTISEMEFEQGWEFIMEEMANDLLETVGLSPNAQIFTIMLLLIVATMVGGYSEQALDRRWTFSSSSSSSPMRMYEHCEHAVDRRSIASSSARLREHSPESESCSNIGWSVCSQ